MRSPNNQYWTRRKRLWARGMKVDKIRCNPRHPTELRLVPWSEDETYEYHSPRNVVRKMFELIDDAEGCTVDDEGCCDC